MPRKSLWTVAVLVIVFLLAEAPYLRAFLGGPITGLGDEVFLRGARAKMASEGDAALVECVLPGQIRPLGSTTYVTRGRTIKTTKKDCETRGGRPVAPSEPGAELRSDEPAERDDRVSPEGDNTTD